MSETKNNGKSEELTSSQKVLLTLKDVRRKLEDVNRMRTEPIAIIGMSCRFPGHSNSPSEFWSVFSEGKDTASEVPPDRWKIDDYYDPQPGKKGKMYVREASFMDNFDEFDAEFFGISPREVMWMDPQQRILLEVCHEALERAGEIKERLTADQTGVFIGIGAADYAQIFSNYGGIDKLNGYLLNGTAHNAAAGRISFCMGLQGPSMAVDTACSSSLVAVHEACQSIRSGECTMAIAGGVNIILAPEGTVLLCQNRMVSPSGRSKTFDASADGYGRGEGCGIIILKPLSLALADRNPVLALIRGSSVNQDGPSSGLTVPNGPSQQRLMKVVLQQTSIDPSQVCYVEAHGTGTSLGDPIEVNSIWEVYGKERTADNHLYISSAKTNIGHLEPAAGIAGIMKLVLMLQNKKIPKHLHLTAPNPHIDWGSMNIKIPSELTDAPTKDNVFRCAINGFGASGTNAHVILEEAQPRENVTNEIERTRHILTLSAKNEKALLKLIGLYSDYLERNCPDSIMDICYTANTSRLHNDYRLAITADTIENLNQKLKLSGNELFNVKSRERTGVVKHKTALLFSGQGSQYQEMGRLLYQTSPSFKGHFDTCNTIIKNVIHMDMIDIVFGEHSALLDQTQYTQPALFTIEYALAKLIESWGINTGLVLGHSVGEYVAACIAGIIPLEDALRLICKRGELMQSVSRNGSMICVLSDATIVNEALCTKRYEAEIACINSPDNTVISGCAEDLEDLTKIFEAKNIKVKKLQVSHAFHSSHMDEILKQFSDEVIKYKFNLPKIECVSNVTGKRETSLFCDPQYWVDQLRSAVHFRDGMEDAVKSGCTIFIEIGPKPALLQMGQASIKSAEQHIWTSTLRKGQDDWDALFGMLEKVYTAGLKVNWKNVDKDYKRRKVILPVYPFQRKRYWFDQDEELKQTENSKLKIASDSSIITQLLDDRNHQELLNLAKTTIENIYTQEDSWNKLIGVLIEKHHKSKASFKIKSHIYTIDWTETLISSSDTAESQNSLLIIHDESDFAQSLVKHYVESATIENEAPGNIATVAWDNDQNSALQKITDLLLNVSEFDETLAIRCCIVFDASFPDSIDTMNLAEVQRKIYTLLLKTTQAIVMACEEGNRKSKVHLIIKTSNDTDCSTSMPSIYWGFTSTFALEKNEFWGSSIEYNGKCSLTDIDLIKSVMSTCKVEDRYLIRNEKTFKARMLQSQLSDSRSIEIIPAASYIITGATGGLGKVATDYLYSAGARNIICITRSSTGDDQMRSKYKDCRFEFIKSDCNDLEKLQNSLDEILSILPPVKGIIHTAGLLKDAAFKNQTLDLFENVMTAKVNGTWNLHLLSLNMDLDFFVLFSSIAGVTGSTGQLNYSTVNSFIDTFSRYRAGKGLKAHSIAWGPWNHIGMSSKMGERYFERLIDEGIESINAKEGTSAFELLLQKPFGNHCVWPVNFEKLSRMMSSEKVPSIFKELVDTKLIETDTGKKPNENSEFIHEYNRKNTTEKFKYLTDEISKVCAGILGFEKADEMDHHKGFFDLGMDSLMSTDIRNKLQDKTGLSLPATITFEYPTIIELAQYIQNKIDESEIKNIASEVNTTKISGSERHEDFQQGEIAIVGIGCRFPGGAESTDKFWELLEKGIDTVSEIPLERFDINEFFNEDYNEPGTICTRFGSFLKQIDQFDHRFFDISSREVDSMDPQQRLLLEVAWESLEDAAYPWNTLKKSKTGVFIGIGQPDYSLLHMHSRDMKIVSPYTGTGNAFCFASGRVAYILGLQGPVLSIDTACSSSLVGVHYACKSLLGRECDLALAGGVQLMISPESFVFLSRSQALAPDGRCKTFDASANGFGRGEGCGIVTLMRLDDAVKSGRKIYAVISGSAINHDGPSSGLTVPNAQAQQDLLRSAYVNARINPAEVSYIEAHGTGTILGDPIELRSISEVLDKNKSKEHKWYVGSVKTNIGHCEAAAGVAGLIKVALSLQKRKIPAHLHFRNPNPQLDWSSIGCEIPTRMIPWEVNKKRIAGISSFGLSGTNAHIVLSEYNNTVIQKNNHFKRPLQILTLSAKTNTALETIIDKYSSSLGYIESKTADVCYSANTGRKHFNHRVAVIGENNESLGNALGRYKNGNPDTEIFYKNSISFEYKPKIAFLFTGQGNQYSGMGKVLYESNFLFRQTIDECSDYLKPVMDITLQDLLFDKENEEKLNTTRYTQPALFSIEYALYTLWKSWGIQPDFLFGHSIGEYTALCASEAISLEQCIQLTAMRGKLMQSCPGNGTMAAILTDCHTLDNLIKDSGLQVVVACKNSTKNNVVAGPVSDITQFGELCKKEKVAFRPVNVSHAFHSPLMEPVLNEFISIVEKVTIKEPVTPIVSNVNGAIAGIEITSPDYWGRHLRNPVCFAEGLSTLDKLGCNVMLELGPKPNLIFFAQQSLENRKILTACSLSNSLDDWKSIMQNVCKLYTQGISIDWQAFDKPYGSTAVSLPTYPFERSRHWIDIENEGSTDGYKSEELKQEENFITGITDDQDSEELATTLVKDGFINESEKSTAVKIIESIIKRKEIEKDIRHLSSMVYMTEYVEASYPTDNTPSNEISGNVMIFGSEEMVANIKDKLHSVHESVVSITSGIDYCKASKNNFCIDFNNRNHFRAVLDEIDKNKKFTIVYIPDIVEVEENFAAEASETVLRLCMPLIYIAQEVLTANFYSGTSLWVITRNAQSMQKDDRIEMAGLVQSPLWGIGKTLALEIPKTWGGMIDVDKKDSDEIVSVIKSICNIGTPENQIVIRGKNQYYPRVKKIYKESDRQIMITPGKTYLVTGGMGAIGIHCAKWLIDEGATHVVLAGRSQPTMERIEKINKLKKAGVTIETIVLDILKYDQVKSLIKKLVEGNSGFGGIFHTAGVAGYYQEFLNLAIDECRDVMLPKITGTLNLFECLKDVKIDFFLNFSSISSVWGSKGQCHYGGANQFLDDFCTLRKNYDIPVSSINWGPWLGGGMTSNEASVLYSQIGLFSIHPHVAMQSMKRFCCTDGCRMIVSKMDWTTFKTIFTANRKVPLFLDISEPIDKEENPNENDGNIISKSKSELTLLMETTPSDELAHVVISELKKITCTVLGEKNIDNVDIDQGFFDMGIDSLMALELQKLLKKFTGTELSSTIIFEHSTIRKLYEFLHRSLATGTEKQSVSENSKFDEMDENSLQEITILDENELSQFIDSELEKLLEEERS